jgi:membrane protein
LGSIGRLFGAAAVAWQRDNAPRLGAAHAYYALFSLAPLLIIVIAVAGLAFGEQAAQGQIVGQLRGLLGDAGAEAVQQMVEHSRKPEAGGSVIVLIVWVYYAAQIFFFGAEITRAYAGRHGSRSGGTPAVPA